MDEPAIALRGINLGYGANHVVHDVDLTVHRGTVHVLAGENGSGKSTLLSAIAGRLEPWTGHILVGGREHWFGSPRDAISAGIALVSQELSLVPGLSVAENLGIGAHHGRQLLFRPTRLAGEISRFLDMVGLDVPAATPVADLSTHRRQLVEIARALATGAHTILLDEPTSSIDLAEVDRLFESIRALRDQGFSFILITHRSRELQRIADEVSVLRDGRLVGSRPITSVTEQWLVSSLVGRAMSTVFPERTSSTGTPVILDVDRLSDEQSRVVDASLQVRAGEIVVLSGLVGAGRSELLETIYGARRRSSGHVRVAGDELTGGPAESLRSGVTMIFEERKRQGVVPELSSADNFGLTAAAAPLVRRALERAKLAGWRKKLSIKGSDRQAIGSLSGGNQQKVLVARALDEAPRVLLLDEPTRGVDIGAKADIYRAIADAAAAGCAVLMATSEMEEALGLADRIVVLREGRIVDEQAGDRATEESIIAAATGLASAEGAEEQEDAGE